MKRSPIIRRTPLRPGAPPKRRTEIRRVNAQRLAALREKQFGPHADAVGCLPCAVCRPAFYVMWDDDTLAGLLEIAHEGGLPRVSEPHHATHTRGAGGTAEHVVPLCWSHHSDAEALGRVTFARKFKVRLRALARRLARLSPVLAEVA